MAEIRPFRGLRFNPAKVKDLGSVISPPYDVISLEEREQLRRRSEHNVVRLELPQSFEGPEAAGPYAGAGEHLRRWRRDGVLVQEEQPAIYLTRHEFSHLGQEMARTELTVALRLEELDAGVVRPHEDTRAGAKEDRLNLMLATMANISPVMLLFDGVALEPQEDQPLTAEPGGDERFLTWPIIKGEAIRLAQKRAGRQARLHRRRAPPL